jgi:hypothetical protein
MFISCHQNAVKNHDIKMVMCPAVMWESLNTGKERSRFSSEILADIWFGIFSLPISDVTV